MDLIKSKIINLMKEADLVAEKIRQKTKKKFNKGKNE
jgi:hypothetical protein